jgi:hypothetical protein
MKDDMDNDLTLLKKKQPISNSRQQRNQRPLSETIQRPGNFEELPWDEQKFIYEQEIKELKQQLASQRRYFLQALELPLDLERALRRELGDEKFNLLYNGSRNDL